MMNKHLSQVISVVLLTIIPMAILRASENTDDARYWLNKMSGAMGSKSFKGTFVYQGYNEMVAMNIIHITDENGTRERLISLNGAQGEVIRDHQGVTCILPNLSPVVLDKRGFNQVFPVKMIDVIDQRRNLYEVSTRKAHQVAGRETHVITIKPADHFRYGYRLWVDEETGLLLKSQLIDTKGEVLEQLMYISVEIYDTAPEVFRQLLPPKTAMPAQEDPVTLPDQVAAKLEGHGWQVEHLPEGFSLAEYNKIKPDMNKNFEHMVYTDGLVSVSVFIEKRYRQPLFSGVSHMGAVTAYGSMINEHQVTVVGEVPLETLQIMSGSIRYTTAGLHQ